MSEEYKFTADENQASKRLDIYLAEELPQYTRNFIQKCISDQSITVNGKAVKQNYKLKQSDMIYFQTPEPQVVSITAQPLPLDILYEDEHLLVLNKPQGMVVHPAPGNWDHTLVNALMFHCQGQLSGINGDLRPGIVHRIDKDTSGILVVAKSDLAHQGLSRQLQAHSMKRVYQALVWGRVKKDTDTINKPLGRDPRDRKKYAVIQNGKNAVTHYTVLERFRDITLVELQLETGRTHQIRVHMASIGHPLVGDLVYGPKKKKYQNDGQFLHAKALGFVHPVTEEYMAFSTELPSYFQRIVTHLKALS